VYIEHRLCSEIAASGLDIETAIGFDNKKPIEPGDAGAASTERHADAAYLRAVPLAAARLPLIPLELRRAAVERFLDECARGMGSLPIRRRYVIRLASGALRRRMAT